MTDTDFDPFASAPDEAQNNIHADVSPDPVTPEPEDKPAPRKAPAKRAAKRADAEDTGEGKITVTLKGGSGFDAPWIVVHADNATDAAAQIGKEMLELMELTQRAAAKFVSLAPNAPAGNASASRSSAPAGAQTAPAGSPECPPGWEFKSGVNKNTGKAWKGYFPPRGSQDKPIFF